MLAVMREQELRASACPGLITVVGRWVGSGSRTLENSRVWIYAPKGD